MLADFIGPILEWISAHPHLAGLATFIISTAESVAIIGTIVPGSVMMTAIGTLAGAGVMPLWTTILCAILGAIVGDGISYWVGHYFKNRLHDIWPFRSYPSLLASGETFFHKHGGKSVFIGRFVGPVRALVPLVAGMLNMTPWRFTLANVISAIGWAPAYMLPGIALGAASLELPPDIAVHAILMLLLVGLFIILCLWLLQKSFLLVGNQIHQALNRIWSRLESSRYFSLITTALKHYNPNKTHGQLTLAFYLILISSTFLYLVSYIITHGSQHLLINNSFYHLFRSLRTPLCDTIMVFITFLGQASVLLPVIATVFLWLAWTKRWHTAWHVLALGFLTVIGVELFKHITHSPRPWGILQSPNDGSFPSGHATFAITFYLGFALLANRIFDKKFHRIFYILTGIIIIAICISRVYLGTHWITDILGGILLGIAILMLIVLSYNRKGEKPIKPRRLITVTLLTLFISYSVITAYDYQAQKKNYTQLDWPTETITLKAWWRQEGKNLPLYRLNRFGLSTKILNLQWVGDLSKINSLLLKNGWQLSQPVSWIDVLHRISDIQSTEHLPLVSPLYLDKNPILVLTKPWNGHKKLLVLRLWQSNTVIENSKEPLWVGAVEVIPRTYSWLFKRNHINEINITDKLLFLTSPKVYDIKIVSVKNTHQHHKKTQSILLIKPKII